ncbi:hypothetical protein TNCV_1189681 [Trichonephila clavipes]|nr:hypothetical protein TNCV_1189681 [Trichonephila clavipes]
MYPKIIMSLELFRTIGSTNQKLPTPQDDNTTVESSTSTFQIWDGGSFREPYAQLLHRRYLIRSNVASRQTIKYTSTFFMG